MNPILTLVSVALAVSLVANIVQGANAGQAKAEHRAELAQRDADKSDSIATASREVSRELSRLIQTNQEIQHAYNDAQQELSVVELDRARTERVRDAERGAIAAAAGRATADACGRYATAAERDIAGIEADATTLGLRAAGTAATAHALKRTLDEHAKTLRRFSMPTTPFTKEPTP